jgi:hypothetical protein
MGNIRNSEVKRGVSSKLSQTFDLSKHRADLPRPEGNDDIISSPRNVEASEALTADRLPVWIYQAEALLLDEESSADFSLIVSHNLS